MQTVKGYVENGNFYPTEQIIQNTTRAKAVLTVLDEPLKSEYNSYETRMEWLKHLKASVKEAQGEYLPDIVRSGEMRLPINLSEQEMK